MFLYGFQSKHHKCINIYILILISWMLNKVCEHLGLIYLVRNIFSLFLHWTLTNIFLWEFGIVSWTKIKESFLLKQLETSHVFYSLPRTKARLVNPFLILSGQVHISYYMTTQTAFYNQSWLANDRNFGESCDFLCSYKLPSLEGSANCTVAIFLMNPLRIVKG